MMMMEMNNRTKLGALFLASSLGVGVGRITAAPPVPSMRVVGMTIEPAVSVVLEVEGRPSRVQCSDASGLVVKLNGKEFPAAKGLCDAANQFASGAKASVGLLSSKIAETSKESK